GIARCQNRNRPAAAAQNFLDRQAQRRRPCRALGLDAVRQHREVALAANHQLGRLHQSAPQSRQLRPAALAQPDDREPAIHAGRSSINRALTAAAANALPPRRPRKVRYGIPRVLAARSSFDSAAPTKPTGNARIADGRTPSRSIRSISRNSAVGALPIAITLPSSRSAQRSIAAALRVLPISSACLAASGWSVPATT